MIKTIKTAAVAAVLLAVVCLAAAPAAGAAEQELRPPFTLELKDVEGTGADYVDIDLGSLPVTGTHIGITVNPVYAVDQNGNRPKWSMFRFVFTDASGNTYDTTNAGGVETTLPGAACDGSRTSITWMYGYLWPLHGFYGTMYLPWAATNGGTADNPTAAPTEIVRIRIQHNSSYTSARREMLAHFFTLTDATVDETERKTYIGDVKILEDFEPDTLSVTGERVLYDFADTDLDALGFSANKAMNARTATAAETAAVEALRSTAADDAFNARFTASGQRFSYTAEPAAYGRALKWTYGSYYDEYDSSLNSYGSLGITLSGDKRDFAGAKGLTLWVNNPQPYPISFNLEFAEAEAGGAERWNLNGTAYRTLYLYDTRTGEEFSVPTLNVAFIPGDFCGWVRIPFSQYACPDWSAALEYTDGVYDENKPHTAVYITSQFILNDNVTMYFDNIGLYYNDFEVGRLFGGSAAPGIADCLSDGAPALSDA